MYQKGTLSLSLSLSLFGRYYYDSGAIDRVHCRDTGDAGGMCPAQKSFSVQMRRKENQRERSFVVEGYGRVNLAC